MWVGVFPEAVNPDVCRAMGNFIESLSYVRVLASLVICYVIMVVTPIVAMLNVRWYVTPSLITIMYACWFWYLSDLCYMIGEIVPGYLQGSTLALGMSMVAFTWLSAL